MRRAGASSSRRRGAGCCRPRLPSRCRSSTSRSTSNISCGSFESSRARTRRRQEAPVMFRPTILCPVDLSDASGGALRYARAIAEHFESRLIVLTVEDPLLTEAVDLATGVVWSPEDTRRELARFVSRQLQGNPLKTTDVHYEVAVGKP